MSVLMIPHDGNLEPAPLSPGTWVRELQEFTNRNASRIVTLEVFDEPGGDRVAERERPLRGVDYDPRSDRVDIMLGELEGTDGHRSHSVAAPRAIELLRRGGARDLAIRVAGGDEVATIWIR